MSTNFYPGISYKTQGVDFNYFNKISVTATTFGGGSVSGTQPDIVLTFNTQSIMMLNLGSGVVEYSLNGTTIHGELNSANASAGMVFDNRVMSMIWLRIQSGSTGPIIISIQAWGTR